MNKAYFFLLTVLFLSAQTVSAQNFTFSFNLKFGGTNQAVYEMQKILNQDTQTRVASFGPGSPGNETLFFGSLTKRAVILFQEKYAKDILSPLGLTQGTGFVGEATRLKLNQVALAGAQKTTPSTTSGAQSPVSNLPKSSTVYISSPSVYSGLPGTKILILGGGFTTEDNSVSFGSSTTIAKLPSKGGSSISVVVPDIASDVYDLKVTNANGTSIGDAFFVVTKQGVSGPNISSVTPGRVSYGAEITIKGSGFTSDNQIRTPYEIIKKVASSDGTTLRFKVAPYPDTIGTAINLKNPTDKKTEWKMQFYVVNKNGVTPSPGEFTLEL